MSRGVCHYHTNKYWVKLSLSTDLQLKVNITLIFEISSQGHASAFLVEKNKFALRFSSYVSVGKFINPPLNG